MNISANQGYSVYQQQAANTILLAKVNHSQNSLAKGISANQEAGYSEVQSAKPTEAIECQTCKERKYVDGSNDPGVSFKTPAHISPEASAGAVMSHEQEHVRNERANAAEDNRRVVSQSVTLQTSICPECGSAYVSGGLTKTVTKADNSEQKDNYLSQAYNKMKNKPTGMLLDVKL